MQSAHPAAPNVPTVAEAGYPEFTFGGFLGLFGPRDMTMDPQERIAADTRLTNVGLIARGTTPAEFATIMDEQRAKWSAIQSRASTRSSPSEELTAMRVAFWQILQLNPPTPKRISGNDSGKDRDGQHSTREDSARMIADNHRNESDVGTSAEDTQPQHEERRRRRQRHGLQFAESVQSLRAIGIAEQRNERDPNRKQGHQLRRRARQLAWRVEQP
jgi:hypothetical protein